MDAKFIADEDADLAQGEYTIERDKWLRFGCPKVAGRECMIALRPQTHNNGASWQLVSRDPIEVSPSINCNGAAGCGWHGFLQGGKFVG